VKPCFIRSSLFFTLLCAVFSSLPTVVLAQTAGTVSAEARIGTVEIKGNQRIEPSTILSYLGVSQGSSYSQYDIDTGLKNLFATGFFADVNLDTSSPSPDRVNIVVNVVENPIINRIAFEGNVHKDDKDLEAELELKPRAIYTRTKVQNDVKRVLDIYRRSGRFSATVNPKVITLDQNRVDLVFEVEEGTITKIQNVSFIGNTEYSDRTLEKIIRSSETVWYKFLSDDDKYDPDRLQYDQELLRRFYTSEGYADFQVKSAIAELTPDKDAFYVTFTIEEGKKYQFGEVNVSTSVKGLDSEELKKKLTTVSGEHFSSKEMESSIESLTKELGDKGYAFVDINPETKRDPEKQTISLNYNIKEGPRVYVERINIIGNVRTIDDVIRREFKLAEGDAFSTSRLARTEQRLKNLGFFEKVDIQTKPGSAPDRTQIDVNVQEKSTGEITLGAGFSTVDGAVADIGIKESNLLGRGQNLRFKGTIGTRRQQYDIGFTEPYFLDRELAAGFDLFKINQDLRTESSFDRNTTGGALRVGYALSEHLQHTLRYRLQQTDITNIREGASRYIREQGGVTTNSSISQIFTWEDRDNRFAPTDGYFLQFTQEYAGIGGNTNYLSHEFKGGYYIPFGNQWTLQFLGSGGHILGVGEKVRIQDRFFLGGNDMRGFENSGVGPRDKKTTDALGGNTYYTATSELHFPVGLTDDLGFTGAVFVDAGSLWDVEDSGADIVDNSKPRFSAGVGLLWSSPFGPIRIDFAKALIKEDVDQTQNFHFSFGTRF
jgi:outer membrane protein insertion porin family